jgi:hypothetical protein
MEVKMNRLCKSFLAVSLVMTSVGLFASFTRLPISLLWTVLLPYGVIFFGLFLINFIFQKEFADYEQGTQKDAPSPQQRKAPSSEEDLPAQAAFTSHWPAYH